MEDLESKITKEKISVKNITKGVAGGVLVLAGAGYFIHSASYVKEYLINVVPTEDFIESVALIGMLFPGVVLPTSLMITAGAYCLTRFFKGNS